MNILTGLLHRKLNVEEQEGKLICLIHNQLVSFMIVDDQLDFSEIFLCQRCVESCGSARKLISLQAALNQFSDTISQRTRRLQGNKIQVIGLLQKLQQELQNYKSDLFEKLITLEEQIQDWINFTNIFEFTAYQTILQQLECQHEQKFDFTSQIEKFIEETSNYHTKVEITYQKLWESQSFQNSFKYVIRETQEQLEQLQQRNEIDSPRIKQPRFGTLQIQIDQVGRIVEKEMVYSIALNKTGDVIVMGLNRDIKIWTLTNGKLEYQKTLAAHRNLVTCLQFSKLSNQFFSGSADSSIKCWKQPSVYSSQAVLSTGGFINWNKTEPDVLDQHSLQVTNMILNKREDELLSCSFDSYIKVWKVYSENNQILLEYTLPAKHYDHILSMSLNQSETKLVSCGEKDKMIVLWIKNRDGRWEHATQIYRPGFGNRIGFMNENQFIWAQNNTSIINCFTIEGRFINEENSLDIKLDSKNSGDFYLFPAIYNENKQVLLFKHGSQVYIIRQKTTGLSIESEFNCGNIQNFGTFSGDGIFLALYKNSEMILYKIN